MRVSADAVVDLLQRALGTSARDAGGERILIGLVGRGIQSSRTPAMHEREGARLGLPYRYALIDFDALDLPDEALPEVLEAAEEIGFAGLNVTHPFKQAVIPHLTRLAPEASAIGAVNTVVFSTAARTGHNTDCWGFVESFRDRMVGAALERVALIGAGGGGAAVAYALLELGAKDLAVVDSDSGRAERLAHRLGARVHAATPAGAVPPADGVVNATPVGMAKYPGTPFAPALLSPRHWVAEIVYFPRETELLRTARALGCRTLPGVGMAVYQAVRAFELFTGRPADRTAMAEHFEAAA